jgi:hypothetical protein
MTVQKQQETMLASEQEAPSSSPQWHAPVLNIYNAEDAEHGHNPNFSDFTAYGS